MSVNWCSAYKRDGGVGECENFGTVSDISALAKMYGGTSFSRGKS